VRQPVDSTLLTEIRERALRFTCPDCLYFLAASRSCAHGWPNHEHLEAPRAPASGDLTDGGAAQNHLVFCKEFDLR
jgi:hypothetical protein